jgi:ornithine carbamoyltransferase
MRHFLHLDDWSGEALRDLLTLAAHLKREQKAGGTAPLLRGKQMAMIFQKPSLRTRVSFEVGMTQLGGSAIYVAPAEIGLGERESIPDVGRVLSRYVDAIMARVFGHDQVMELASCATVPVINGLSAGHHPCQALADVMTIREHCGDVRGVRVVYVGDANNVALSLSQAVLRLGGHMVVAAPAGYQFSGAVLARLEADARTDGGSLTLTDDPFTAVRGADIVYTDTWVSMGQEAEMEARLHAFRGFTISDALLAAAGGTPKVMHCLPAHRGCEITDAVADGTASIIFDQAENRLHAQKAVLVRLLTGHE